MPFEIDLTQNAFYKWAEACGVAKAEAKAVTQGFARGLSLVLESRFGALRDTVKERIAAAERELLEHWLRRVHEATTLEAVFADH